MVLYSPKIMHTQELVQEVLAPLEQAGSEKLNCAFSLFLNKTKFDKTKTQLQIAQESFANSLLLHVWDTRGSLGSNLLRPAILIYLACREHRNEGIIHRLKDESEFLAKKKTFEANIFNFFLKGEPISKLWVLQIKKLTVSLCSTICDVYASWKFFMCPAPPYPLEISTF